MQAVHIYGKSREKRRRRRKPQPYTFTCENCGTVLRWHVPRKEGVFCEKCFEEINKKVGD